MSSLRNKVIAAEKGRAGAETKSAPWRSSKKGDDGPGPGLTAAELAVMDFPPAGYAVCDLLSEGLTVLGGRPKQGKSWLSLLIGWAVAGDHLLDGRPVRQGAVMYLALEDTRPRLKGRINTLAAGLGWVPPAGLTLHTRWPRATEEERGLYFLADWLESQKDAPSRLVIVDTLAKFRQPPKGTGNSYQDDYEAVGGLKELLDYYRASGLLIHHTRKLKAEDPFDELSGTLGISGAADSLWVLDRERGSDSAKLFVTGRDLADKTIPLTFQKDCCRWVLGAAADGIDAAGRDPEGGAKAGSNKVGQCMDWLREFLREHAHPSKEIEAAAKAAGYSFSSLRDAKAALGREGTNEMSNHKFGAAEWWSGLGPRTGWRLRPGKMPDTSESSESSRNHWADR